MLVNIYKETNERQTGPAAMKLSCGQTTGELSGPLGAAIMSVCGGAFESVWGTLKRIRVSSGLEKRFGSLLDDHL